MVCTCLARWEDEEESIMATEEDPKAAAAAGGDEEDEPQSAYKTPAQKSLDEIKNLDQDDESLVKYKKALLEAHDVKDGEFVSCWPLVSRVY